ncbi:MAG TPA: transcription antitermination factor NusB, partial [Nocardioidaceae bacterium]|nr:transcription antitermination factor NusB [Nocardioidaceae bacterium]
MSRLDPARRAAFDVLTEVRTEAAYTNLVLPRLLRERGLSGRDARFTTELVSGTIRMRGLYDAVLAGLVNRPLEQVEPAVLDTLRLGCHQLLSMRVPTHAAVGTTVDLVRGAVGHRPAGFVNAVLRKVARHDVAGWVRRVAPDPGNDPVGYAAVAHSHPRWVVERLQAALGPSGDELEELLAADNAAPRVSLVARPGAATVEELLAAGAEPGRYSPYAAVLPAGDPGALEAVRSGRAA